MRRESAGKRISQCGSAARVTIITSGVPHMDGTNLGMDGTNLGKDGAEVKRIQYPLEVSALEGTKHWGH